jgi:hypothetical protein
MLENNLQWEDVPDEYFSEWMAIFYASQEGINLSSPCPVCGHKKLHCYYHPTRIAERISDGRKYVAHGDLWQWCSNCRKYVHASAFVPEWWSSNLKINLSELRHDPEAIEKALKSNR